MNRTIRVLNVKPRHDGPNKPSRIELALVLDYIKDQPLSMVELTPDQAIELIEQLAFAVRVTRGRQA